MQKIATRVGVMTLTPILMSCSTLWFCWSRVEHVDGRLMEPEILTEAAFKELCTCTNPSHTPHAVEILSPHEICLTYKQGITLSHVAGELMAIESWMDFRIIVTVVVIKRSKLDAIVEARQKH